MILIDHPMPRKRTALAIHLTAGLVASGAIAIVLLGLWYPPPFASLSGGLRLLALAVAVNLAAPLLTAVVYRPGKPGLRFDLWVIGLVQVLALGLGTHVAHQARPIALVVTEHRAKVIHANEMSWHPRLMDLEHLPRFEGLPIAYAEPPHDRAQREALLFEILEGQPDIDQRSEYFEAMPHPDHPFWAGLPPLIDGTSRPTGHAGAIASVERRLGAGQVSRLKALPLLARRGEALLALDPDTGQAVAILGPGLD